MPGYLIGEFHGGCDAAERRPPPPLLGHPANHGVPISSITASIEAATA